MEIISVDQDNKEKVVNFLREISLVHEINEEVIMNGEFVYDEEITGLLSFEEFNKLGLIRYFIFRKVVGEEIILELFKKIITKAKARGIKALITLVVKKDAIDIFKSLGFYEIDQDDVFIEETAIKSTKFKDAYVLKYDLQ